MLFIEFILYVPRTMCYLLSLSSMFTGLCVIYWVYPLCSQDHVLFIEYILYVHRTVCYSAQRRRIKLYVPTTTHPEMCRYLTIDQCLLYLRLLFYLLESGMLIKLSLISRVKAKGFWVLFFLKADRYLFVKAPLSVFSIHWFQPWIEVLPGIYSTWKVLKNCDFALLE